MAFGDLKGTLSGTGASTLATNVCAGSVSVNIGDLILLVTGNQTTSQLTGVNDSLGNTYIGSLASIDAGAITCVMRYAVATNAGTLTAVNVTANTSSVDWAGIAFVFEGPFEDTASFENTLGDSDNSSPFDCPASGALATELELVVGWFGCLANTYASTAPFDLAGQVNQSTTCHYGANYRVVVDQSSQTPQFTGTNPSDQVLGTASFSGIFQGGNLAAQAATVEGGGLSGSTGTGALASGASAVDGTGVASIDGSGALASGAATAEGDGLSGSSGDGSIEAGASQVEGDDAPPGGNTGDGDLGGQPCQVDGVGVVSNRGIRVAAEVSAGGGASVGAAVRATVNIRGSSSSGGVF